MRIQRLLGLVVAAIVGLWLLGAVAQLGESLFDHGGVLPSLVLTLAFLIIVARVGLGHGGWASTPYW